MRLLVEWQVAIFEWVPEEIPRVRAHEIGHREQVSCLISVAKELQGHRGEQAWRSFRKVGRLREAHDHCIRAFFIDTCITLVVIVRNPFDLRNNTLSVSRLDPLVRHCI